MRSGQLARCAPRRYGENEIEKGVSMVKRMTKSKATRGVVTYRIVYASRKYPHARNQELKVDLRRGEAIDTEYAGVDIVAARSPLALAENQDRQDRTVLNARTSTPPPPTRPLSGREW